MKELTKEKMMTIKGLVNVLGVGITTIRRAIDRLYPDLSKNGTTTYLNEMQASEIMEYIKSNKRIDLSPKGEVSTKYLENKKIIESMQILISRDKKYQQTIKDQKEIINQKTDQVKRLTHNKKLYTTTEISKELELRSPQELNLILKEKNIQYKNNGTWVLRAEYSEKGYESIKQMELETGQIIYDRKWTGLGRDFILNLFKENNNEIHN